MSTDPVSYRYTDYKRASEAEERSISSADILFDYVYNLAQIDRPNGGWAGLSQPIHATPFNLPKNLHEEADL